VDSERTSEPKDYGEMRVEQEVVGMDMRCMSPWSEGKRRGKT